MTPRATLARLRRLRLRQRLAGPELLDLLERRFFVSGTKAIVNNACASETTARKPKVAACPSRCSAAGNNSTTIAFATHCVSTGTIIAVPRMLFGKISGTSVQNTGPIHEQKQTR